MERQTDGKFSAKNGISQIRLVITVTKKLKHICQENVNNNPRDIDFILPHIYFVKNGSEISQAHQMMTDRCI